MARLMVAQARPAVARRQLWQEQRPRRAGPSLELASKLPEPEPLASLTTTLSTILIDMPGPGGAGMYKVFPTVDH